MFNLNNIDLSKEYRSTDDELKSAKSYIYQLVQELDYRLGLLYGEGGAVGVSGGEDEQPLVNESTFYQATGSSGAMTLTNGTITQTTLVATDAISGGENIFSISDGGIKVSKSGKYKITGSLLIKADTAVFILGCYIKKGTAFSTSSEIFNANIGKDIANGPQFGVTTGSKVIELSANDIVYLCARVQGGTGTVYTNNRATYLLVEKV